MCLATASAAAAQDSHLLIVVGLGGDAENAARFHGWAAALVDAARTRHGLPADHVTYLGEDPGRDPGRIAGRSTREGIEAALGRIAAAARPGDRVFIVLIGHGATATRRAAVQPARPRPDRARSSAACSAGWARCRWSS